MDFSGEWPVVQSQDNIDNPHLGEYVGIPLSREAIRRAEIWDASIQSLPEWQCRPHSAAYIKRGPSNLRVWKEIDPASRQIIAFQTEWLRSTNTPIYMDGRPHPPEYAAHTWGGFSTGTWEGDRLARQDDAHERGLLPAQRRAAERQSDADRVPDAPPLPERGLPDVGHRRVRPRVPDGAADSQHRVPAQPRAASAAVSVHDRHRGRAPRGLRAELAARQERSDLQLLRLTTACRASCTSTAPRRCIPSIAQKLERVGRTAARQAPGRE